MSSKFKIKKFKEVFKVLEILGFAVNSQKGSHIKMLYNNKSLTLPNHKELAIGTLNEIYKKTKDMHESGEKVDKLFLED